MRSLPVAALGAALALSPAAADAFCGFFVGQAGAELYNSASQVVIVHDDGNTVLTMVNDFNGPLDDFALVVPVPVVLEEDVVRVADMAAVDHLDAYSAPRLAEYHDPNPCARREYDRVRKSAMRAPEPSAGMGLAAEAEDEKVVVERSYTVGEYDIVILSSTESNALEKWLKANRYNIPTGASKALRPYVRSGMKFFVAKVNAKAMKKGGFTKLRPLQFAFPDPRFMLPVRLGMLNANGPQELIAYVITPDFRVEPANYRSIKMPSNVTIPTFVRSDFPGTYRAVFEHELKKTQGRAVFTEYAWNMASCDPCASPPLSRPELEELGVWWLGQRRGAFVTRLHARYEEATFPEDLMLKTTRDGSSYQVRYVLQNPFTAPVQCREADAYFARVHQRRETEVGALAQLTGWSPTRIRERLLPLPEHFGSGGHGRRPDFLDRIRDWFAD